MKTFLLTISAILVIVTGKAQFSENFDASTINSLTSNCWVLNGVSTTTQNGETISGTSIYTAPPTSPGAKIDLYSPILNIISSTTTITFDYRLTSNLGGSATRSIQVGLVNLTGNLVASQTITMGAGTNTDVKQFQNTFNSISAGSYRVVMRITGAQGNGNVRLVLDNFQVSNMSLIPIGVGSCILVPIIESVLPIKLINFDARYNKPNIVFDWSTGQEKNFSHFVLEQSTDGINFSELAIIFGAGESDIQKNYNYIDRNMNGRSGLIYYRLNSVDIDGKSSFSNIRIIKLGEESSQINITTYPNPAKNEVRITIPANWQNKKAIYQIVGTNGQALRSIETANSSQTETINISSLTPGLYFIKVTCEGQMAHQKIIKQ